MPLPGLNDRLRTMGVALSAEQITLLERYAGWLRDANEKVNLTAITRPEDVETKHFADSLSLLPFVQRWAEAAKVDEKGALRVVDVGTGGGLPGIPLAIARPGWQVTLMDSVRKKARLVEEGIGLLGLADRVQMVCDRVENVGRLPAHREKYDLAVARAVAALPVLAEWLLPLVRVGGGVLCPRGDKEAVELDAATEVIVRNFPGTLVEIFEANVPDLPGRKVAVLLKTRPGSPLFPRPVGQAVSKPLT